MKMNNLFKTIVFLDIDGVLATNESQRVKKKYWYDERSYPFEKKCVRNFNALLNTTNAEIVLSSSWKLFYSLNELNEIFKFNSVNKSPIDITEELGDRNLEIEKFAKNNDLKKFVIFDDLSLICFPERFIKTEGIYGLTEKNILKAIEILDNE